MAGDWIKIEKSTLSKPEVHLAAEILGISRREALGLFLDYWSWLDDNLDESRHGLVTHVSRKSVEEQLHCAGFAAILERIGWANFDDEQRILHVINWQRHNGKTAKTRALAKDRQSRKRHATRHAFVTQDELPEKRREESITRPSASGLSDPQRPSGARNENGEANHKGNGSLQKATTLPREWFLPDDWKDWAVRVYRMEPERVVRISLSFRDYWWAKSGQGCTKRDWQATWRNWVRKEVGDA